MTPEKVKSVLSLYESFFINHDFYKVPAERQDVTKSYRELNFKQRMSHLKWMCEEASRFVDAGRIEKAMRWLGFLQGVLCVEGYFTIDELGKHSMPDPESSVAGDE